MTILRAADRRIHRALNPAWCDRCGKPIHGRSRVQLRAVSPGMILRVELHRRCPITWTDRGRFLGDTLLAWVLTVAAVAVVLGALSIVTGGPR